MSDENIDNGPESVTEVVGRGKDCDSDILLGLIPVRLSKSLLRCRAVFKLRPDSVAAMVECKILQGDPNQREGLLLPLPRDGPSVAVASGLA